MYGVHAATFALVLQRKSLGQQGCWSERALAVYEGLVGD